MKTKEITIQKAISPIAEKAHTIEIIDESTMREAVEILSKLNKFNDNITAEKEKITKPLNEALKAERNRWKPAELENESAIEAIRLKMSIYQTEQVRLRKSEEEAIARRIGEGKGKLKLETAVKKLDNLNTPQKNVATDVGDVQFRETQVLKIINHLMIPDEYYELNEAKLLKDLKAGKIIAGGAELEIIQTPVNYR